MIQSWDVWKVVCGRIGIRAGPHAHAQRKDAVLEFNEHFEVVQVVDGEDGQQYLKLRDGRGWVFARDPSFLALAIAERVLGSKVEISTQSFSIRFGKQVVIADQDLITHEFRVDHDAEVVNISQALREGTFSRLVQFTDGAGYVFNAEALETEDGYVEWLKFNRAHACMLQAIALWEYIGSILHRIDMLASQGRNSLNVLCHDSEQCDTIAAHLHARGFSIYFPVRSMLAEKSKSAYKCGRAPLLGDDGLYFLKSIEHFLEYPPNDNEPDTLCVGNFKLIADVNLQSLDKSGEAYRFCNFSALWNVAIKTMSDDIKDENAFIQVTWPELSREGEVMNNRAVVDIKDCSILRNWSHRACILRVLRAIVTKSSEGRTHVNVLCEDLEQRSMIEEQMRARGFHIRDAVRPMLTKRVRALLRLLRSLPQELARDECLWVEYLMENPPSDEHIFAKCAGSFKIIVDVNLEAFAISGIPFSFAKRAALPYLGADTKDEQLLIQLSWEASSWVAVSTSLES